MSKILTHQPQGLVEVNHKSPFLKNLVALCICHNRGFTELMSGTNSTPYSSTGTSPPTTTISTKLQAVGRRHNTQSFVTSWDTTSLCRPWPINSYITLMCLTTRHGGGSGGSLIEVEDNLTGVIRIKNPGTPVSNISFDMVGGWSNNRNADSPDNSLVIGTSYVIWGRHRSDNYLSVALDKGTETLSATSTAPNSDGTSIKIRMNENTSTATPIDHSNFLAALWSYPLSREAQLEITDYPWNLIKPVQRKIYIMLSPAEQQQQQQVYDNPIPLFYGSSF